MFPWLRLQDRTINIIGKSILFTTGMQKRSLEGIPMIGGFLLDVFTLGRIDQLWSLGLQVLYLVLIFVFLWMDQIPEVRRNRFTFFWKYYTYIIQFCFGGLLSAYSIFYFKSASSFLVILFALVLFVLMVVNESRRFHSLNFPIKYVLASLCLCSFLVYLLPIIFHWMNWFSFLLSIAASFFVYLKFIDLIHPKISWKTNPKHSRALWGSAVSILFTILYLFKLVPPVPLTCREIGVYHDVKREGDKYQLMYSRPVWKFWQKGDQTFLYRDGDKVFIFTSVFAPTHFEHRINIRWEKLEARGWQTTDVIPIPIKGGREEGYRGVSFKQSVSEGKWRVKIETEDGRELRRLRFNIKPDTNPSEQRIYRVDRS